MVVVGREFTPVPGPGLARPTESTDDQDAPAQVRVEFLNRDGSLSHLFPRVARAASG